MASYKVTFYVDAPDVAAALAEVEAFITEDTSGSTALMDIEEV